jgi:hypothetical protein
MLAPMDLASGDGLAAAVSQADRLVNLGGRCGISDHIYNQADPRMSMPRRRETAITVSWETQVIDTKCPPPARNRANLPV